MYELTQERFQEAPIFTEFGFGRLLEWLDDGVDSHGERYLEMRTRLVQYFDRRNRPGADELADETLNRVAKTLAEHGRIATRPPARYCYVVARFVLLEDFRRSRKQIPLAEPRRFETVRAARARSPESEARLVVKEERLNCLDRCLQQLRPEQRELAIEYFRDAGRSRIERRRQLATRLAITMNALGIRACRVRESLMKCVESCRRASGRRDPNMPGARG